MTAFMLPMVLSRGPLLMSMVRVLRVRRLLTVARSM